MTPLQSAILSLLEYAGWMFIVIPMSEEFFNERRKPILLFAVFYVLADASRLVLPNYFAKPLFYICMIWECKSNCVIGLISNDFGNDLSTA